MRRLALAARDALFSGRFVSVWSILASFPLSLTLMIAPATGATAAARVIAILAAWACFASSLAVLSVLERALRAPRARAVAIATGLLTIAALRPWLQDAWLSAVGATPTAAALLPFRVLTNVIVWSAVFVAIAIVSDALGSLRRTNALLHAVLSELASSHERAEDYAAHARRAIEDAASQLRGLVSRLRTDAGALPATTSSIREHSHALDRLADQDPQPLTPVAAPRFGRDARLRLRVPPRGLVGVLYVLCLLPAAASTASFAEIAVAAVLVLTGGYAADRAARSEWLRRRGTHPTAVFLAASGIVGLSLSAVTAVAGADPGPVLVPMLAYLALATGIAACAGALHGLRVEQHRMSAAVTAHQRAARATTAADREALRTAADLLHRDGQAACTIFSIEHPHRNAPDLAALADRLDEVIDRVAAVFAGARTSRDAGSVDSLLATWGRVLELRVLIAPNARILLDGDAAAAGDAYEIIAEGLLNALKHGRTRHADVAAERVLTGAGTAVRVRVSTPGPAEPGVQLNPRSHVGRLGARLVLHADRVILEASIPIEPSRAIVSAEHHQVEQTTAP